MNIHQQHNNNQRAARLWDFSHRSASFKRCQRARKLALQLVIKVIVDYV